MGRLLLWKGRRAQARSPMITSLPSGSRTRAMRSPQGWSAGSSVISTPALPQTVDRGATVIGVDPEGESLPAGAGLRLRIEADAQVSLGDSNTDVAGLPLRRKLVLDRSIEQVAIEAQRPLHVGRGDDRERVDEHIAIVAPRRRRAPLASLRPAASGAARSPRPRPPRRRAPGGRGRRARAAGPRRRSPG